MRKAIVALLFLAAVPAAAQVPFFFPPAYPGPTAGTNVIGTEVTRASVQLTLDATGNPVISCWRDGGLMGKACELVPSFATNAGFSGFKPGLAPSFHDLRALMIYHFVFLPEPDWSIPLGCVTDVDQQGGGLQLVTITDGTNSTVARCSATLGGYLSHVCAVLEIGDCGTFEGAGTTTKTIFQIVARKDYLGL